MNVEHELPLLFEQLADEHSVGPPPPLNGSAREPAPVRADRSRRLPLLAAAACCIVLVAGLVAIGTRTTAPSPSTDPVAGPVTTAGSSATSEVSAVDTTLLDTEPEQADVPFVEDPNFPVNMLDGEALDNAGDLRVVTTREIVDLRAGDVEGIAGLPDYGDGTVATITEVGDAMVVSVECPVCDEPVEPEVFVVREGTAGRAIASGRVSVGLDGIWVTNFSDTSCSVSEVALDGSSIRTAREIDCELFLGEETSLGVVATRGGAGVLVDPDTLEETELPGRVVAVFNDRVLVESGGSLAVVDPATDIATPVELPESDGSVGYGITSPDERHVMVVFGNPAWPGPRQLLDLWSFDTVTSEWSQLPGMPVAAALKSLAIDWAPDGRFVVLGDFDGVGRAVVTWIPEEDQLSIRTVKAQASSSIVALSDTVGD